MSSERLDDANDEMTLTASEVRKARRALVREFPAREPDLTAKQVQREQRRLAALAEATRRRER